MEQLEMNCVICDNNMGHCRVKEVFSLTEEENTLVELAWKFNNNDSKCFFWGKGRKKKKTHGG